MKILLTDLAGLLVLATLLWALAPAGDVSSTKPGPSTGTPVRAERTGSDFQTFVGRGAKLEGAPASWRGTVPDGELRADGEGNLIVTEGVRRRFDYFLSALGEEALNVLRARVAAHLDGALPSSAAHQAWDLFERYIGYRAALRELEEPERDPDALRRSLEQRQALRARWFDAVTREAFFGFRDRYDRFALERRAILEDDALSAAQKAERVRALEATLPEDIRHLVEASRRPGQVASEVALLREQGASEGLVYQLRERELGAEAARRLSELDRRREEWDRRYAEYRDQRRAILDSGQTRADQQAQIKDLRARLFDQAERRRVEALDRIR